MKKENTIRLLEELRDIYFKEGGKNFLSGISGVIDCLSEEGAEEKEVWSKASSIYRTMASSKSGFSEFYIDRETVEERIKANARLDEIRKELWVALGY